MNEFLLRYATLYAMNMSKYAEAYMHVIEKLICSIEGKSNFLCKSSTEWAKCWACDRHLPFLFIIFFLFNLIEMLFQNVNQGCKRGIDKK